MLEYNPESIPGQKPFREAHLLLHKLKLMIRDVTLSDSKKGSLKNTAVANIASLFTTINIVMN